MPSFGSVVWVDPEPIDFKHSNLLQKHITEKTAKENWPLHRKYAIIAKFKG